MYTFFILQSIIYGIQKIDHVDRKKAELIYLKGSSHISSNSQRELAEEFKGKTLTDEQRSASFDRAKRHLSLWCRPFWLWKKTLRSLTWFFLLSKKILKSVVQFFWSSKNAFNYLMGFIWLNRRHLSLIFNGFFIIYNVIHFKNDKFVCTCRYMYYIFFIRQFD